MQKSGYGVDCWFGQLPASLHHNSSTAHCVSRRIQNRPLDRQQVHPVFYKTIPSSFATLLSAVFFFLFWKRWTETYGLLSGHSAGIMASNCFVWVMPLFEGYSMVLFKKAVLWFWMDNLVAHFTIRLSFRVSSDLCHMDTEWRSGTANCTAGCSKRQRGTATPAGLDSAVVLTCNGIGLDTCKGHNWREE